MLDPKGLEALARAYDREEAAQMGEPSPWDSAEGDAEWLSDRIGCAAAGLTAYLSTLPSDVVGLLERLTKVEPDTPGDDVTRYYRNPDGPDAAAALSAAQARIAELEDDLSEERQHWPTWGVQVYQFLRKLGYYEGSADDLHLPDDLEEWFDGAISAAITRAESAEAEVSSLRAALAPFAAYARALDANDADMADDVAIISYVTEFRGPAVHVTFGDFRAAALKEGT